jgi:hypothetical protein
MAYLWRTVDAEGGVLDVLVRAGGTSLHQVSDVLAKFAKIVQPRSFEDLKKYGFDDPPKAATAE